jgi:hypothetical protein
MVLLVREDMLDQSAHLAHLGLLAVGFGCPFRYRSAGGLAPVNLGTSNNPSTF